ncbi:MAG TPA: UTP--glucose-1-phosphate uridylyltransferase GalU [Humisphaera sp.]|jgi:UTP--glucose-1-phosphate uridylyltransferase|nr:UTP--glucose-1-phosphate uridylyltransferase GalU [Humisphaera sp.]
MIKAVIPVAGFGTRMLPAAKSIPKEMMPVVDRPVVQYVVEEAADAGIDDVLLVTARQKHAIEDHFDRNAELEERLRSGGKESLIASVEELAKRVKIHAVRQAEQRGLGDAVLQARAHVGDQPFLCMLGDTIFSGDPSPASQLLAAHQKLKGAVIGLEEVAAEKVSRYGIVGGMPMGDGVFRLTALVEKPSSEAAPSRLAIAARYLLTPAIFDCIEKTPPGRGGEIQLTDALRALLEREPIFGVVLSARRHDIGNPLDWLKTNVLFAARDPKLRAALLPLLKEILGAG